MTRFFWLKFFTVALLILVLIPPLILLLLMLLEGMSPGAALAAVTEQYAGRRQNPLANTVLGAVAVVPLALIVLIYRLRKGAAGSTALAFGGGVGIVLTQLWANLEFWPNFLPGREYPGFPHGLEIVIGSLFFAPVAMLVGVVIAALWLRGAVQS